MNTKRVGIAAAGVLLLFMFGPTWRAPAPLLADAPQLTISNVSVSGDIVAWNPNPVGGPPPTGATIGFDFTKVNNKACSATVTVSCVANFTLQLQQGSPPTIIGTPQTVLLPATFAATGLTSFSCTNCYTIPGLGQYFVCVMANYKDNVGMSMVGPSGCISVLNGPDTPTVTVP